jgi:signal transduction histidine kinase/CheY-like chemotaxis protein
LRGIPPAAYVKSVEKAKRFARRARKKAASLRDGRKAGLPRQSVLSGRITVQDGPYNSRKNLMKKNVDQNIFVLPLFFLSALLVLCIAVYTGFSMHATAVFLRQNIESRLVAACQAASLIVSSDELARLTNAQDLQTPAYAALKERLIAFGRDFNVTFVYYMRETDAPGMVQFIIDNDTTEDSVGLGTPPLPQEPAVISAFAGKAVSAGLGAYSVGYNGLLSAFAPVRDAGGRVIAVAGVDITDEQVIALRNRFYLLLCLLVFSVTVTAASGYLGFSRYRQKVAQAEAASISKSTFLANMSHEIRTPLNAITGMTDIGKNAADPRQKDYCLGKIEDASSHLIGIINDILDISKIEASKFELSPSEFYFEDMLQKIVGVINFKMAEKQQDFFVRIAEDIPARLKGDEQRLAQVITNLLSNAVKFTPVGGSVTLEASALSLENDVCTLRISVSDTGIGITPEQSKRLFHSFEQADSSITRKFGGTGLGLAISRRIVEMMDGEIRVDSEIGKGAVFTVTVRMPLAESSVRAGEPAGGALKDSGVSLLLADSSARTREYFQHIARQLDLSCELASDGKEALELLGRQEGRNGAPTLCFVDRDLPDMPGLELARRIKSLRPELTVVAVAPVSEWTSLRDEAAVTACIAKPFFRASVEARIRGCLGGGRHKTKEEAGRGESGSFAGRRLLLADDVEINREIVTEFLKETGMAIVPAENGRAAVELFSAPGARFDLVLMDVQMPEMDGYEATRRIREQEKLSPGAHVPIIAMTANVFQEDIDKCLNAGMDGHLGKPINMSDMLALLHARLRDPQRI